MSKHLDDQELGEHDDDDDEVLENLDGDFDEGDDFLEDLNEFDFTVSQSIVTLGTKEYTFEELFIIHPETISEAFSTQAARLAYLGMVLARSEASWNEAKTDKEAVYATLDIRTRELFAETGEKVTEGKIKSTVAMDGAYIDIMRKENDALLQMRTLKALVDAMRQRGDMMISLGATLRQEWDMTDVSMKIAEEVKKDIRRVYDESSE